jgi:hypothetical protein
MLIFLTHAVVIANKFNEYFVNVGPNLAKGIRKNDKISFEKYLKGNNRESMFAETVTEYEILTEIDRLSSNKSAGHDNISAKMIKTINQEICKPLSHIFNLTFDSYRCNAKFLTCKISDYCRTAHAQTMRMNDFGS